MAIKKYIKVRINAVLEAVVYSDEEGFEDSVQDKLDEGDFEIYEHAVDDWTFIEDWDVADIRNGERKDETL